MTQLTAKKSVELELLFNGENPVNLQHILAVLDNMKLWLTRGWRRDTRAYSEAGLKEIRSIRLAIQLSSDGGDNTIRSGHDLGPLFQDITVISLLRLLLNCARVTRREYDDIDQVTELIIAIVEKAFGEGEELQAFLLEAGHIIRRRDKEKAFQYYHRGYNLAVKLHGFNNTVVIEHLRALTRVVPKTY